MPMKLLYKSLGVYIATLVTAHAAISTTVLTFDSLPTSSPDDNTFGYIPNGYGGVQWSGFGVINGTQYSNTAYHTGLVSPDNVAFNFDYVDRRAYISSITQFNLRSAYLTSGIYAPMQVEVVGFIGPKLAYDNTYALSASGPTLVNFNYQGVTEVEFLPQEAGSTYVSDAYIFAMDNLLISPVPEPNTSLLLSVGAALGMLGMLKRKTKSNPAG